MTMHLPGVRNPLLRRMNLLWVPFAFIALVAVHAAKMGGLSAAEQLCDLPRLLAAIWRGDHQSTSRWEKRG